MRVFHIHHLSHVFGSGNLLTPTLRLQITIWEILIKASVFQPSLTIEQSPEEHFPLMALSEPCRVLQHQLWTCFSCQRPHWRSDILFSRKTPHIPKTSAMWFPSAQIPINSTHRPDWKILKKGIQFFFSLSSYEENKISENGKHYINLSDKKLFFHGIIWGDKKAEKANWKYN